MNAWTPNREYRLDARRRRRAALHLKRCPLCGTLNSGDNRECVTCRWRGEFERDPFEIEAGLLEILQRCPEIDVFSLPDAPPRRRSRGLMGRVFDLIKRKRALAGKGRRLDVSA